MDGESGVSYELLPHTADIRAVLRGADLAAVYCSAVDLLRNLLVGNSPVLERASVTIELEADDDGERLFRFIRELLYLNDVDGFVPARLAAAESLAAGAVLSVAGECFDPARHVVYHQPKAITRHAFAFRRTRAGVEVEMVFDL